MNKLAARIRELREKKEWSQQQLADEIGTSQRQISKYENELQEPTAHVLYALAGALDTTVDYLLGLTNIADRPLRGYDDLSTDELAVVRALRESGPLEAIRVLTDAGGVKKIVAISQFKIES